jgi:hypothetical protein
VRRPHLGIFAGRKGRLAKEVKRLGPRVIHAG